MRPLLKKYDGSGYKHTYFIHVKKTLSNSVVIRGFAQEVESSIYPVSSLI